MGGAATSGASTPASRESPVPPVVTQLSKQDISQFKLTNTLSSELSFLEMQDWKEEVLNWFKIANHTNLDISMQKHILKIVVINKVFPDMKGNIKDPNWLPGRAILTATNKSVDAINDIVVASIPGASQKLHSVDGVDDI